MKMHDEHYLRIQRLYNKADTLVGLNHRMAAEKFQVFGKDAMERIEQLNRHKFMIARKARYFEFLSEALLHYTEYTGEHLHADETQILAFFRTKQGCLWFSNLQYCIWFLTKARSKRAANAARELFSPYIHSERRHKLEQMTQIKAFVNYIHFMAKDIQDTNVVKVDFKTGEKIYPFRGSF